MEENTMPNHVAQQLSIIGEEAPTILQRIAGNDEAVDFNNVIPMPKELDIADTVDGRMGLAVITGRCDEFLAYHWVSEKGVRNAVEFAAYVERERPHAIDLARQYVSNQQKFGHATWYDWCIANWGTKWNAYFVLDPEYVTGGAMIRFSTAWSPATPVIARLSEIFPLAKLTLRYFDECWNFAGEALFEAGEADEDCFDPDQNDPKTRRIYHYVYGDELDLVADE
jgi:hypothetical protein